MSKISHNLCHWLIQLVKLLMYSNCFEIPLVWPCASKLWEGKIFCFGWQKAYAAKRANSITIAQTLFLQLHNMDIYFAYTAAYWDCIALQMASWKHASMNTWFDTATWFWRSLPIFQAAWMPVIHQHTNRTLTRNIRGWSVCPFCTRYFRWFLRAFLSFQSKSVLKKNIWWTLNLN